MKHGRWLVALAVVCGPTACGGGGGGPTDTFTLQDAWETYVRTDCAKGHECRDSYPGTQADFVYDYGVSVADCTTELEDPDFLAMVSAYEHAAIAHRLTYDAAKAKACFDAWAAQACGPYWQGDDPSPACDEIFKGTIATGSACTIPDECVSATCDDLSITCS